MGRLCNMRISLIYYHFGMFGILGCNKIRPKLDRLHTMEFFDLSLFVILLPYLVLVRSEKYPTMGVAIPSAICPANNAEGAAGVFTTRCKKKNR